MDRLLDSWNTYNTNNNNRSTILTKLLPHSNILTIFFLQNLSSAYFCKILSSVFLKLYCKVHFDKEDFVYDLKLKENVFPKYFRVQDFKVD